MNSVIIGAGVGDRLLGGGTDDPSSASWRADSLLERHFPASSPNLVLLVRGEDGAGVDSEDVAAQGARLAERLAFEPRVSGVVSYWQTGSERLRSADRSEALILAHLEGDEDTASRTYDRLAPDYRGSPSGAKALDVSLGGSIAVQQEIQTTIEDDLLTAELIALPLTLIILFFVFGGAVAALLPLGVGVLAILGTNAVLRLLTEVTDVSVFAQNLTTALGLGLAIDYALLIVRRFREELHQGADRHTAVRTTLHTAGRAVLFSALTVAVSLAAMLVFPLYFLRSFAYAGLSVVLLAAAASLIVLPAVLLLLGHRVDALSLRRTPRRTRSRVGLVERVVRRPARYAATVTALLVAAGIPFLQVEFGTADDRQLPAASESRLVQDAIRDGFAASSTGGVEIVVRDGKGIDRYAAKISLLPNAAEVDTPLGTYRDGRKADAATPADASRTADGRAHLSVVPKKGVEDVSPESQRLVEDVRAAGAGFEELEPLAGGRAAALVDSKQAIADGLPAAALLIAGTSLLLVFLLTGSLLIPLLSVASGALSLTAMFGLVVWVFQDGNLSGPLGFTATGTIEATLPVLMFCIAFGLSMDYGVFLLSRMKEEYDRTGDSRQAIVTGVRRTSGVITAAALIIAVVFVAIGTSQITNTKMLGLGAALAVLVDATVVRGLLVPAVMRLGGRATWWAPAPLVRFQRRFGLREEPAATPERDPDPDPDPETPTEPVLETAK
ncbi:MMPL family transporter [Streptomyces yaizuensis]|uniref:MMPL family transporter n=1 Tax=Streptomyces yaizuensis TaxID=2989713 RepID=A0ABQ5P295_9ACTN|nr:MMPL family transporter [Streptomyces sp. YSPA8]GLF96724.1 MMPL family transporter [Streptomyces sp. YSPA8]